LSHHAQNNRRRLQNLHFEALFQDLNVTPIERNWLSRIRKRVKQFESSAPDLLRGVNEGFMKKSEQTRNNDLRPEYDFASMKGGIRGKHVRRFREGTNIVLLEPEVAEAFPTEDAVNEALRGVLNTTRAVRRTGGLANKTLHPSGRKTTKGHTARG